jgi:predicted amidophosphoribosyltransferase
MSILKTLVFQNASHQFKIFFNSCYTCASFLTVEQDGFCNECGKKLLNYRSFSQIRFDDFKVTYLYNWIPDQNRPLSLLLEDLKNGNNPLRSEYFGKKLLFEFLKYRSDFRNVVVIPAPGRVRGSKDHAFLLASSLAKTSGWELISPLSRTDSGSQKDKTKQARGTLQFTNFESFSFHRFKERPILFVDDIVTTGATARAAYVALGRPRCFEVLSIAHRKLSSLR